MVGSRRCYICREPFVRGEEVVVCVECGTRFHARCEETRGVAHCPRCVNEGWISLMEF